MNYLEQIQRGVDFIEANLHQPISIASVASHASMSQWHFQRMFRGLTGDTVKDYIRSRRLGRAVDDLLHTKKRVLDIALEADFESQESFTRAFKDCFEVTPARFRKTGKRLPFPQKLKFDQDYLAHINQDMNTVPEIYEQIEKYYVGLPTRFFGLGSEKNNIAQKLPPLWQAFLPRLAEIKNPVPGACYGMVEQLQESSDELAYFAVREVSAIEDVPAGMVAVICPATTYARFAHHGQVNLIDNTVSYIYSTWLPNSGRRHSGTADLECYGPEYCPGSEQSLMHYAIPIS